MRTHQTARISPKRTFQRLPMDYSRPFRLPPIQLVAFKECTLCHELLPATIEYFTRAPERQQGFVSRCRQCVSITAKRRKEEDPERGRESGRQSRYRRQTRITGAEHERFGRLEIFERDNWICGEPIDKNLAFPHLKSATLDHVHPLSKGGPHTRDNVQCAHWFCNSRKRARVEIAVS